MDEEAVEDGAVLHIDVLYAVFQRLEAQGLANACGVCKLWLSVASSDRLWVSVYALRWPRGIRPGLGLLPRQEYMRRSRVDARVRDLVQSSTLIR